jgi:hypothetical protein
MSNSTTLSDIAPLDLEIALLQIHQADRKNLHLAGRELALERVTVEQALAIRYSRIPVELSSVIEPLHFVELLPVFEKVETKPEKNVIIDYDNIVEGKEVSMEKLKLEPVEENFSRWDVLKALLYDANRAKKLGLGEPAFGNHIREAIEVIREDINRWRSYRDQR